MRRKTIKCKPANIENIEVGNEVFSLALGNGIVTLIKDVNSSDYPIFVKFDSDNETFTRDGRWEKHRLYPELFLGHLPVDFKDLTISFKVKVETETKTKIKSDEKA